MEIFSNSDIDEYIMLLLLVSIAVLSFIITIILYYSKIFSEKKDEALIISLSSYIIGSALIITGSNNSSFFKDIVFESLYILVFLIIALSVVIISKIFFNKLFLAELNDLSRISRSIMNFAVIYSMSWIIRSLTIWLDSISLEGVKLILVLYLITELMFYIANIVYFKLFLKSNNFHNEKTLKTAINYFGYRISLAFVFSSVTAFIPYDIFDQANLLINWILFSLIFAGVFIGVILLVNYIIDKKLNIFKSIATSILKSSIYISISLIISGLIW